MNTFLFTLPSNPIFQWVAGIVFVVGVIVLIRGQFKSVKVECDAEDEALNRIAVQNKMAVRHLVAQAIERGDYLHMGERDFQSWLAVNEANIFPHEREAMVRARIARSQSKS